MVSNEQFGVPAKSVDQRRRCSALAIVLLIKSFCCGRCETLFRGRRCAGQGWLLMGALLLIAGCEQSDSSPLLHLPAPLRDDFPYELSVTGARVWEAGVFEITLEGMLRRIVLAGLNVPAADHPQVDTSIDTLRDWVEANPIRIQVIGRDRYQREIAFVYVPLQTMRESDGEFATGEQSDRDPAVDGREADATKAGSTEFDVGLRLIQLGLAWHDGFTIEHESRYREAEREAMIERRASSVERQGDQGIKGFGGTGRGSSLNPSEGERHSADQK